MRVLIPCEGKVTGLMAFSDANALSENSSDIINDINHPQSNSKGTILSYQRKYKNELQKYTIIYRMLSHMGNNLVCNKISN
jgi:hypothetical protein